MSFLFLKQLNMHTKNTLYQWRRVARLAGRKKKKKGRQREKKKRVTLRVVVVSLGL